MTQKRSRGRTRSGADQEGRPDPRPEARGDGSARMRSGGGPPAGRSAPTPAPPPGPWPVWPALVAAALLAALALIPWRFGDEGAQTIWSLLADPTPLATGGGLQSPLLVSIVLLTAPLAGMLVLVAFFLKRSAFKGLTESRGTPPGPEIREEPRGDAVAAVAVVAALPPLYTLFMANPTFAPSPLAGLWESFVGVPVALGAFAVVAGLAALRTAPEGRAARFAAGGGAALLLAATAMPAYEAARWRWPIGEAVAALGEGTFAGAGRGGAGLALFAAAALTILALPYAPADPARDRRRGVARSVAFWLAAVAYPLWFLLLSVDAAAAGAESMVPAWPRFLLAAMVTAFTVWFAVLGPRLLARADATQAGRGLSAPGWRGFRDGGLRFVDRGSVLVVFVLFFLLKTHGLRASVTDENIYFYGAHLLAHGQLPYRDFFFAHPPGHLLVPGALFAVFGFSLTLAKLIPVAATMISGAFVLAIGRVHFGRLAGLAALVAFLFANEVLKASTNLTGINLTTMWLAGGLWAVLARRWATAGAFLGAAVATGFYSIAAALAVVVLAAFAGRRAFVRLLVAFLAVAGGLNAASYAIGGASFIEGVYAYHGKKPQRELLKEILVTVHYHPLLLWSFVLTPLAAVARRWLGWTAPAQEDDAPRDRAARRRVSETATGRGAAALRLLDPRTLWDGAPEDVARLLWLVTAALTVEFTLFKELHSFYFTLWFPGLALLVGYAIRVVAEALRRALGATADGVDYRKAGVAAVVACLAVAAWLPVAVSADASIRAGGDRAWIQENEHAGEAKRFQWIEPPLLPSLGDVVRVLFWRDERIQGSLQPGYAWYLQSKKRYFETAQEIADYVRDHSEPGETLTGASTVAPLIALLSGRELSALVIDTNTKRFKAGTLTRQEFWDDVCRDRVRFVVAAPQSFFAPQVPSNHPTVDADFRVAKLFRDRSIKHWGEYRILLFERGTPDAPKGEPVCHYLDARPSPKPGGGR